MQDQILSTVRVLPAYFPKGEFNAGSIHIRKESAWLMLYGNRFVWMSLFFLLALIVLPGISSFAQPPNIVIIYTDDLGFGDIGAYGNRSIPTPHMDALCSRGLRFTEAYATAATCTPSRYSLLTGRYNWRQAGTGVARGNAGLIIDTAMQTLPKMLQQAGYVTGMIGKWHLGLGGANGPDWNGVITPGVLESGFDYAYYMPSTNDRVPCVYIENNRVLGLDANDPIEVSYTGKIGDEPTGRENPELLSMHPSHGHDQTIINGISRIGFMKGGMAARWRDQDIADTIALKAKQFMGRSKQRPFFLYFNPHDIHVPRTPHERFVGKSGHGLRGDALLELDWTVGEVMRCIDSLGLSANTLVILSSDNGPVVDDGYHDLSVAQLQQHVPGGIYRGGKYSIFEAGTRLPFVTVWPGRIAPGISHALISQVDLFASLAALAGGRLQPGHAMDSRNHLDALLGSDGRGRSHVVMNAWAGYAIREGNWKYILPAKGSAYMKQVDIETGISEGPQLYDLDTDKGEKNNVALQYPEKVAAMKKLLEQIQSSAGDK